MEGTQITRGRPRKTKIETIGKYLDTNELDIWYTIEHHGVV